MNNKINRIKELVIQLNEANKAYYQEDREIMSNLEYDKLYDELQELELETGFIMSDSPTNKVGYEVISELPKEEHDTPMLSLDKTKEIDTLKSWLSNQKGLLSWKLDGLTIVLTYINGELSKAVTRGSGVIGEVITNNARVFKNIPLKINYKDELILRGEAVIKYSDFNKINEQIAIEDEKYKNPRNLCSGTVRQLNNEVTAKRNVHFFAFQIVKAEGLDFANSKEKQLEWLKNTGFEIVEYKVVNPKNIEETVMDFANTITDNDFGSDGLVLTYDNIEYSKSLGATSKFPKDSIAFKWADELKETTLKYIEWSTSRTGLINPIAVFDPVELEGTTVSRASVHNLSILEALALGEGDTIKVYKANMIIPQIADNITMSGVKDIPEKCPVCDGATEIKQIKDVKVLYCTNDNCQAKLVKSINHFVSRDAMNIEGFSEATIEKFIQQGYISNLPDIYHIEKYKEHIVKLEGFGQKSYNNLIKSINKSRQVSVPNFIYSLGIFNVGLTTAKLISKAFNNNFDLIRLASREQLLEIPGIGDIIASSIVEYFNDTDNQDMIVNLLNEIDFKIEIINESEQVLAGKTFVITGSVEKFANRNELKNLIESKGGKVTGSVTNNTDFLINNDVESSSSKNKKAKELNVPIINEEQFIEMLN